MASVLTAHPHFSVFRKSTSSLSLDQLARTREQQPDDLRAGRPSGATTRHRRSLSVHDLRARDRVGGGGGDDDLVETLATPPGRFSVGTRPATAARLSDSPTTRTAGLRSVSSGSEASFHLDSAELPSLNFGDRSSSASSSSRGPSPVASPSLATTAARERALILPGTPVRTHDSAGTAAAGQMSGIRLVPDSPPIPARTRTPLRRGDPTLESSATAAEQALGSSASPAAASPSKATSRVPAVSNRMRASTTASGKGPVERVQFSPLGLCPSPLLTAPTLPPPPPPPPPALALLGPVSTPPTSSVMANSAPRDDHPASSSLMNGFLSLNRKGSNGILKAPKTPGTGRSVRFSSSTVERTVERWMTPPEDESASFERREGGGHDHEGGERASDGADQDVSPCSLLEHATASVSTTAIATSRSVDVATAATGTAATAAGDLSAGLSVHFTSTSFLSRLQAVIPSPDNSLEAATVSATATATATFPPNCLAIDDTLTSAPPPPPPSLTAAAAVGSDAEDPEAAEEVEGGATREADVVAADAVAGEGTEQVAIQQQHVTPMSSPSSQKRPRARLSLMDESNPFLSLQLSTASEYTGGSGGQPDDEVDSLARSTTSTAAGDSAAALVPYDPSASLDGGGGDDDVGEEPTLLMQASLMRGSLVGAGGGGGTSFGGQSFVEVSHLKGPPSARFGARTTTTAPAMTQPFEAVQEATSFDDGQTEHGVAQGTSSQDLVPTSGGAPPPPRFSGLPTSAGTPSRPSPWSLPNTTPRRPSPLTQEAEFSFASSSNVSISALGSESAVLAPSVTASTTTSLPHGEDVSVMSVASSPAARGAETILDESAGSLVEIRPIDPSPPPPPSTSAHATAGAGPSSGASQAPSPTSIPISAASSLSSRSSSSFYRQLMAARAREGLSQSAKEEWERLERGEKVSPKEQGSEEARSGRQAGDGTEDVSALQQLDESFDGDGKSVYWSPQKTDTSFSEEDDGDSNSVYVDAESAEGSLVEVDDAPVAFLSPIAELVRVPGIAPRVRERVC